ncbi:MAG: flagellar basal-body MS-ring/collar protein FliF [Planctomycetota bacterium]|nr:flagellar basal-body MS-ring/collar protein FliF [Planctomycetota bacterium]
MAFLTQLIQQVTGLWSGFGRIAKIVIAAVGVLIIAGLVGVAFLPNDKPKTVLFSSLSVEDAAAIGAQLDTQNVTYELTNGGTTILVDPELAPKLRMDLAVDGLPIGAGKGFEIFDETSLGTTPFAENVNYNRAVQGELARTINTLKPIAPNGARVHIVQPEPTPFVREQKPVTASVVLTARPGAKITNEITAGIVALVAGSVKGLERENVTVLDSFGHVLDPTVGSNTEFDVNTEKLKYQREVESHLGTKAQEVLARLMGPGRAVVRVAAKLKFVNVKTKQEQYDPDGQVLRHEIQSNIKATRPVGPRGVAGAASNLSPVVPTALEPFEGGDRAEETMENRYEISRTETETEDRHADIERLTVAVILVPNEDDQLQGENALGISLAEAEKLVKQAVGFDDSRDQIQTSIATWPIPPIPEIPKVVKVMGNWWDAFWRGAQAGSAALACLAGLIMFIIYRIRKARMADADAKRGQFTEDELKNLEAIAQTLRTWMQA